ncbi:MAG: alpha/beta hydrolase [Deltaproteobacteria bacterium]|nr:alpha/beta hydrolase [Deltaproteobacteria bacterium]
MTKSYASVCFSHGKESGPWGTKIKEMAAISENLGFAVESIDYRRIKDPDERVAKLLAWRSGFSGRVILVGSSMGAYVAAVAAEKLAVDGLFLLAPAISIPGFGKVLTPQIKTENSAIIHGWEDEIIPASLIIDFARKQNLTLHLLPGDHRLMEVLPAVLDIFSSFLVNLKTAWSKG